VLQIADASGAEDALSSSDPEDLATAPVDSLAGAEVQVSYADFAQLHGGGWADRLHVVAYPACYLTTPEKSRCSVPTAVKVDNDVQAKTLSFTTLAPSKPAGARSAGLALEETTSVYALKSGTGGYGATPVPPAGSWQVGTGSGNFSYDYPLTLPPATAGSTPSIGFAYSSGAVDGMTSAANGQADPMGVGWTLDPGSITRSYYSCNDDGATGKLDLCWHTVSGSGGSSSLTEDLTLDLNGRTDRMIRDESSPNTFRLLNDPGWKITRYSSSSPGSGDPSNGDNDNEAFQVVTPDGVQYWFGWGHGSDAVATVPVYGNDAGEPCHGASSSAEGQWCQQGWQWMLDRVVDTSGNVTTYDYTDETNYYQRWGGGDSANTVYTAAVQLASVSYGVDRASGDAQEKLSFSRVRRCTKNVSTSGDALTEQCTGTDTPDHAGAAELYPDVPTDLLCSASQSDCQPAPSFFTTWMYSGAKTTVATGANERTVDSWRLNHSFPDPDAASGDADTHDLWLKSITRTGQDAVSVGGGSSSPLAEPAVSFTGVTLPNRVLDKDETGNRYFKFRIGSVLNETGGRVDVTYGHPTGKACDSDYIHDRKKWESDRDCFDAEWLNDDASKDLRWSWFQKYLVTRIDAYDDAVGYPASGGSATVLGKAQTTTYDYLGDPGWRYTASPSRPSAHETWSDWRGYGVTLVRQLDIDGTVLSRQRIARYRGMNGAAANPTDLVNGTGQTARVSTVEFGDSGAATNANDPLDRTWLNGETAETAVQVPDGQTGAGQTISRTYDTWTANEVVTVDNSGSSVPGVKSAKIPIPAATKQVTSLFNPDGTAVTSGTTSLTRTISYQYDMTPGTGVGTGRLLSTQDSGDPGTSSDNTCTRTEWATNSSAFVRATSRTRTWGTDQACGPDDTAPATSSLLSDQQTYYDSNTSSGGSNISKGLPTAVDVATGSTGGATIRTTSEYDAYGRVTKTTSPAYTDAPSGGIGSATTTNYNPGGASGGLTTSIKSTQVDINAGGDDLITTTSVDPGRGNPTEVVDPNGGHTLLSYDPLGQLTEVRQPGQTASDPANLIYSYTFWGTDAPSRVKTRTLRSGGTGGATAVYDDGYGYYDGWGRQVETQTTQPNDVNKRVVSVTGYDARGQVAFSAPAVPNTSAPGSGILNPAANDVARYTLTAIAPGGLSTTVTDKSLTTVVDSTKTVSLGNGTIAQPASGGVTYTKADAKGLAKAVELHTTHDPANLNAGSDAVLDKSNYGYDPAGRLTSMTKTIANTTAAGTTGSGTSADYTWSYGYDRAGRQIWSYDPDTGVVATQYDAAGQAATVTTGPTGTKASTLDLSSPLDPVVSNPTSVITTTYDNAERPTSRLDATDVHSPGDTPVTLATWAYDHGTDANGNPVPNALGRQVSETVPITGITKLLGGHDGNHVSAVQAYDQRGNVTGTSESVPAWVTSPTTSTPDATTTWVWHTTYNQAGMPTSVDYPAVGNLPAQTVTTTYTPGAGGLVASMVTNDGTTTTSGAANVAGPNVHLADETYDNIGQTTSIVSGRFTGTSPGAAGATQADGMQRSYTWEAATGRLSDAAATVVTPKTGGGTNTYVGLDLGYSYDAAGNPTRETTISKPSQTGGTQSKAFCYTYDAAQRLTRAATGAATDTTCANPTAAPTNNLAPTMDPNYDISFTFNGDRMTSVVDNLKTVKGGTALLAVSYENGNAATTNGATDSGRPHQTTIDSADNDTLVDLVKTLAWPRELPTPGQLTYDSGGRVATWSATQLTRPRVDGGVGSGSYAYHYDHQGRLVQVEPTSLVGSLVNKTLSNVYNADGTRLIRQTTEITNNPPVIDDTTLYLHDGTEVRNGSLFANTTIRRFTTPAGTPVSTLSKAASSAPSWDVLFADGQDTIRLDAMRNVGSFNTVATRSAYYPYGQYTQDGSIGTPGNRGYLDKQLEPSGDLRLDQRDYTPELNQLTAPDPIFTPGDPFSANPYAYARNNPITFSDPSGLAPNPDGPSTCVSRTQNCGPKGDGQADPNAAGPVINPAGGGSAGPAVWCDSSGQRCGTVAGAGAAPPETPKFQAVLGEALLAACSWVPVVGSGCDAYDAKRTVDEDGLLSWGAAISGIGFLPLGDVLKAPKQVKRIIGDFRRGERLAKKGSIQLIGGGFSESERFAAETLAGRGRSVVLREANSAGARTSDLLVDGIPYDVYTPTTGNLDRIVSSIASKGSQVRGGGVVLDLSKSPLSPEDLGNILPRVQGITSQISDIVVIGKP